MDEDQKEYMLNTKLMRNDVTYDITANDIGLDRIRLENYATWKTKGTLYTQRYDSKNQKWAANFMVAPICADAELNGFAIFPNGDEFFLSDEKQFVTIPIMFGAKVENLTDYAKKEHVKQIKSQLFINDILVDEIEETEQLEISSDFIYDYLKNSEHEIEIVTVKVKSTLLTKFTTDGALVDIKEYKIIIHLSQDEEEQEEIIEDPYIEPKTQSNYVFDEYDVKYPDIPPPYIESLEIKVISGGEEKDLSKAKATGKEFVCAGQTITITAVVVNAPVRATIEFAGDNSITHFDSITKKFEWDEPRSRGVSTFFSSLRGFEEMYSGTLTMKEGNSLSDNAIEYTAQYIIPYETKQTLNSWNTLRNNSQDAFDVNENKLFSRIRSPYQIVVKVKSETGSDTKRYDLDVFERWDTIYNRNISNYLSVDLSSYYGRQ